MKKEIKKQLNSLIYCTVILSLISALLVALIIILIVIIASFYQVNEAEFLMSIFFCLLFLIFPIVTIPVLLKETRKAYFEVLISFNKKEEK